MDNIFRRGISDTTRRYNIASLNSIPIYGVLLKHSSLPNVKYDLVFILQLRNRQNDIFLFVDIHVKNKTTFILGSPYLYSENYNSELQRDIENINSMWTQREYGGNILHNLNIPDIWIEDIIKPLYYQQSQLSCDNILTNKKMKVEGAVKLIHPRESPLINKHPYYTRAGHMLRIPYIYRNIDDITSNLIHNEYVAGLIVPHSPWVSAAPSRVSVMEVNVEDTKTNTKSKTVVKSGKKRRDKNTKKRKRKNI